MAQIGSFGTLVFKTSDKKILTFSDMQQKISANYAQHKIIAKKPRSEFLNVDLREVKMTIVLDAMLGVKPRKQLEKIEDMLKKAYANYLVIGEKKIGSNKFVITDLSESWDVIYSKGELARATVDVTFQEYVEEAKKKKTSKKKDSDSNSSKKSSSSNSNEKYTVVNGDTLWDIARRKLGKGKYYEKIYEANKDVIEKVAKEHGKKSSENGHWIWAGTVLVIPSIN